MREKIKTVLILLLALSAAGMLAALLSGARMRRGTASPARAAVSSPLRPYTAALPSAEGYVLLDSGRGLAAYFDAVRPTLSELFGTLSEPQPADAEAWKSALADGPAVLCYGESLPLKAVSDGEADFGISVRTLLILSRGHTSEVFIKGESGIYRALAEVGSGALFENIPAAGTGCALAAFIPAASGLEPETAVPGSDGSTAELKLVLPDLSDAAKGIIAAFGGDGLSARSFFDAEGRRVYITEWGFIYFDSGKLRFSSRGGEGVPLSALDMTAGGDAVTDACRAALAITQGCVSGRVGALQYMLSSVSEEGESVTVALDILADGIYLMNSEGSRRGAVFEFVSGRLTEAELTVAEGRVSYSEGGRTLTPEQNAVLLVGGKKGRLEAAFLPKGDVFVRVLCLLSEGEE